jgi:hypothetical protein
MPIPGQNRIRDYPGVQRGNQCRLHNYYASCAHVVLRQLAEIEIPMLGVLYIDLATGINCFSN